MMWPQVEDTSPLTWESIDTDFTLHNTDILQDWIIEIASQHGKTVKNIHYIFCTDEYMLELNNKELNHDYYTDIITFPLEEDKFCEAEAVISIDRVRDNAASRAIPFNRELHRVLIHGLLHLCGFKDATDEEQKAMRAAENNALAQLHIPQP